MARSPWKETDENSNSSTNPASRKDSAKNSMSDAERDDRDTKKQADTLQEVGDWLRERGIIK
jgi:hypothetical protein